MNKDQFTTILNNYANLFMEDRNYFERNTHMHPIKETPGLEVMKPLLANFIQLLLVENRWNYEFTISKIDLLTLMTDKARVFRKTWSEMQEVADSVLTGYINFVGMKMWIDYALYASDLAKDEKKLVAENL